MSLELILFIFFALIAATSAVLMITRLNPVISALFLILVFAGLSGLYIVLNAQFIAVVQIIVYAGAIMVLFLFVIMLLRPAAEKSIFGEHAKVKRLAVAVGVFLFFQLGYVILIGTSLVAPASAEASVEVGTIKAIGNALYTTYLIPFEAIAFTLLAATIGSLVLAKKKIEVNEEEE